MRRVPSLLQIALQALLDVCLDIVSDVRLGEPHSLRELGALVHRAGWVRDPAVADTTRTRERDPQGMATWPTPAS